MDERTIVFRQGEENGIVVERDNFAHSIFLNQYQLAINIFHSQWTMQKNLPTSLQANCCLDNQFSNVIAFCGDRGEGKTSCMSSFATILTDRDVQAKAKNVLKLPEGFIAPDEVEWLDTIDPSFFDTTHNLLELLLGRMYAKVAEVNRSSNNQECYQAHTLRILKEQFHKVKKDVSLVENKGLNYDALEEISDLAAGVNLRADLQKLMYDYLKYMGKKCLLICIDDLDLNLTEGYKMAEMLRKYLVSPNCIILVAVKIEQLVDVIATTHMNEVKNTKITWDDCLLMAQKYVTKLLPRGNRIAMPTFAEICEYRLKIADLDDNAEDLGLNEITVKERVVQLIFQKTGYVFYNTQRLSPIIPKNLRSLRHLLGLLYSLPNAKDELWNDVEVGRDAFRDYFFGTWAAQLPNKDYTFAQQLAQYDDLTTLNAFVVEYFAKRVKEDAKIEIKDNGNDVNYEKLYLRIISNTNNAANISFGDVMYVLWLINGISLNVEIQNLIFLIKTVYSMQLYACYNVISQREDELYPPTPEVEKTVHIHKAETLYEHVNQLQKLVNGSYFTYPQGALLPTKDKDSTAFRDRVVVPIYKIKQLVKDIMSDGSVNVDKLKLFEYIVLCATRTTKNDEKILDMGANRVAKTPTYLGVLSPRASYLMLDFLQPFTSLCNLEYAYRRFDDFFEVEEKCEYNSLFELARRTPGSLLNTLLSNQSWKSKHELISDAVIRVTDVQWAIIEELIRLRNLHKNGNMSILSAYVGIQNLQIKLYPLKRNNDAKTKPGILTFKFLSELLSSFSVDELQKIIITSKEEQLKEEMDALMSLILTTFEPFYLWPMNGKDVKEKLCDSLQLDKKQGSRFKRKIAKIFKNEEEYTQHFALTDEVLGKIIKSYLEAKN